MPSHTAPMPWKSIGELMDTGAFTALSGFPCGEHNSDGQGILQVRPFNVTNQATIFLGQQKHVPAQAALGKPSLIKGDIVFNNTNTKELVGKTALWKGPEGCVFSNHMTRIRVIDPTISPRYLATAIHAHWLTGRSQMLARAHVAQASILGERFREIRVPWPSYDQQSALARVFEAIDAILASEDEADACAADLKRAAMRALFTKGLRREAQKDTEIGPVPESWEPLSISALGKVITGNTPPTGDTSNYEGGTISFVAPGDIEHGFKIGNTAKKITKKGLGAVRPIAPGSTCFVCIGSTIGKVGFAPEETCATNQQINSIMPSDDFEPQYVFYLMTYWADHVRKQASPSPVPILSKGAFEQIEIYSSTNRDEQREIVAILDAIDRKIDLHRKKRAVLDELFKALLHKLMTGEFRVSDLDLSALSPASSAEVAA